jgi:hypothetical protein
MDRVELKALTAAGVVVPDRRQTALFFMSSR